MCVCVCVHTYALALNILYKGVLFVNVLYLAIHVKMSECHLQELLLKLGRF
jgi:hypothetical protein